MYTCKTCTFKTLSLRAYAIHYRVHRNANNVNFPCAVKSCVEFFSSYKTFVRHISSHHSGYDREVSKYCHVNTAVKMPCSLPLCKEICSDLGQLVKHLKKHIDSGVSVICPYQNCGKLFKVKSSFSAHICRKHNGESVFVEPVNVERAEDVEVGMHNETDMFDVDCETVMTIGNPEEFKSKYVNSIALFYMMLQGKYLIPVNTINKIVQELTVTHELERDYMLNFLRVTLHKFNVASEHVNEIVDAVTRNDIFSDTHNIESGILRSDYMRQKYYKEHFPYVAPVQVLLGCDRQGKQAICHYVPVKDTIRNLFQNGCVMEQYANPLPRVRGILSDVMDGTAYQSNDFFLENKDAIKLIIFQDAFEIVNPLSSAKKKHKVLGVYFTLADFYPHCRSSVAQMQLLMLCKESYCKLFGDGKVFRQLISDLKDLERDGIEVEPGKVMKAALVCIAGDNLGSHYIGGFLESFCAEYSCRYCLAKRRAVLENPLDCSAERTVGNYKQAVDFLRDNPDETSYQGIKRDSVFNQLRSFHVTTGLPPCLGHDLFEGVICYDLALCIKYFVQSKWLTYEILNGRVQRFEFIGSDNANKPAEIPINGDRLGGQAVQNWTLLRFLPLIIGDKVPNKDDDVWQLVLLMIQVTALICASNISKAQVAYLQTLIEEYLEARQALFPTVALRPKHHYLLHYASLILKFGPLVRLWTMRFESKHSYFKQCIRSAQNYKNVTGMLAERHQLFQAYQLNGNLFHSDIELSSGTAFHEDLHCADVQDAVKSFGFTSGNTVVTDSVTLKGSLFRKNAYVITVLDNDHLAVSANCILLVLVQHGTVFFVARCYSTNFVHDLGVLKLDTDSEKVVCFGADTIAFDHPLYAYRVRGQLCIALKSAILDSV